MEYPTVRAMLPRLVVPVAPLYHWVIVEILALVLLLGAWWFGTHTQARIDAHRIAGLEAVIAAQREQLHGKAVADALTHTARKRERGEGGR